MREIVYRIIISVCFLLVLNGESPAVHNEISEIHADDISKKPYLYVSEYGSLSAAIAAVGPAEKTLVISDARQITSNITVPENISIKILKGGKLAIFKGVTFRIKGPFEAGYYQVKTGEGSLVFSPGAVKEYLAAWWGAKGDGAADNFMAIQAAIDASNSSGGGTVFLTTGIYKYSSTLKLYSHVNLKGVGMLNSSTDVGRGTVLQYTGSGTAMTLENVMAARINDITFTTEAGLVGIYMPNTTYATLERVSIFRFKTGIRLGEAGGHPKYYAYYNKFLFCIVNGWRKGGLPGNWSTDIGIHLVQEANDNLFLDCSATQTNAQGIYIQSGANNRILYGNFTNTQTGIEINSGWDNSIIQARIEWMSERSTETAIKLGPRAANVLLINPHIINYTNTITDNSPSGSYSKKRQLSWDKLGGVTLLGTSEQIADSSLEKNVCRTIQSPSSKLSLFFTINQSGFPWNVGEVRAIIAGGAQKTLEFTLDECNSDGDHCSPITEPLTVSTDKASTARITDATIAENAVVKLRIGSAVTVTDLMVCMKGR